MEVRKLMNDPREKLWHREARRQTEFFLECKGEIVTDNNSVSYSEKFIQENDPKRKRFPGHTYDIWTNKRIVEIDDLTDHPKIIHRINDAIAGKYVIENLKIPFYRLLKEEITNRRGHLLSDAYSYLSRELQI
jgi:hypothetical protein